MTLLYSQAQAGVILVLAPPNAQTSRRGYYLAGALRLAPQRSAAVRHGVGNQSAAGIRNRASAPLPRGFAAGHALGPQVDSRRRRGLRLARNGQPEPHLEAGRHRVGPGDFERHSGAGQHLVRQPAGRPLHGSGERPPDAPRHPTGPCVLRRPGFLRQAGTRPQADQWAINPARLSAEYGAGYADADFAFGRPDYLFAVADGAAGGGGDPSVSRRDALYAAQLLRSLSVDPTAPHARLPPFSGCKRAERQGSQDL